MKDRIENPVKSDRNSIWTFADQRPFHYSDGRFSEWYLGRVLSSAKDLSSDSAELEAQIIDWPSEYHLSRKRANLLRGFEFDKTKKVLEVGCGCGAITRFLGETFDDVVAIEGSIVRAGLARLRTGDMSHVSILCAPFQDIRFRQKFDIIFCIGVFEYSAAFVSADDPYDAILQYFQDVLTPDGVLVVGIENQFGLKYFAAAKEDHTGIRFDGLEGYHRGHKAKTFGYDELKLRLRRYFDKTEFYFPYPDYKLPSCVLSENFFSSVQAGELVGNFRSRDYTGNQQPLFDEKLVLSELDKNNKLAFFSNSFLVVAGNTNMPPSPAGIMFSSSPRIKALETITRFVGNDNGEIWVHKMPAAGSKHVSIGKLTLSSYQEAWVPGLSLQAQLRQQINDKNITIETLFAPCRIWLKTLMADAFEKDNRLFLKGEYSDCIWRNSYIRGDRCVFIDKEWEWQTNLHLHAIIIRSIYLFLEDIQDMKKLPRFLKRNSLRPLIREIAESIGITITKEDFDEFIALQSEMSSITLGSTPGIKKFNLLILLQNRRAYTMLRNTFSSIRAALRWIKFLLHYAPTMAKNI